MGDVAENRGIKRTFIVPSIKAFDNYDFTRAKICCSLTWLVAKAFGTDCIPEDLREPFYTDQYEQEHMKPPVANLLLSAELYCRAGSLILKSDAAKPLLGHDAVIQALAQKGLYVTDQERLVTERDLQQRPIKMSAHLAMIDTLMMAYTAEMVSLERVVSCIQKYRPLRPEDDIPYDTEDAVTSWINKVNEHLKDLITEEQRARETTCEEPLGGPRSPTKWYWKLIPARYRKEQTQPQQALWIPPVDNVLKDNTDGCALAALLHFYCPDTVQLEDICLKETMSLADSLYNLQLIQEFCAENLNDCCHFTLEDMLYTSSSIKNNYLVFMAELFWWFEVVKPSFVRPRVLNTQAPDPILRSRDMPTVTVSDVTKRSFMEKPPSPDKPSLPLRPKPKTSTSGVIKRSTSMSYVDGCVGTWPKEKRSSAHGISFDIPFDKEDTILSGTTPIRGMSRSASTDGLGFRVGHFPRNMKRNLSFQPVNGQTDRDDIEEEGCPEGRPGGSDRRPGRPLLGRQVAFSNGLVPEQHGHGATPSIEEALKIIHSNERPNGSLGAEGADNGFFLHGPSGGVPGAKARLEDGDTDSASTEVDTGIHVRTEDIQDEDSSLRDYTVSLDSDADHEGDPRASASPCPSPLSLGGRSHAGSSTSSSSGVRMTSFAEQKFRKLGHVEGRSSGGSSSSQKTTPESSELNIARSGAWSPAPEDESPVRRAPRDPTHMLASEMVQLKMKLEEKRRAIEAQKKKVEAAFTRHRQRMGRTAFLNVVRKKGGGTSPLREEASGSEGDRLSPDAQPRKVVDGEGVQPGKTKGAPDGAEQGPEQSPGGRPRSPAEEVDLAEYTRSIERLNTSLGFLQVEMQRLAQQQEMIMQMREQQQAWVISPPQPSPQRQVRELRGAVRSAGSLSPVLPSAHRSPTAIKRKSASFHSRTPRTPRPSELKVAPFSRMLNTPQSVDSLPRLRRFSPSQTQLSSFAYLGHDPTPTPSHAPAPAPGPEPREKDCTGEPKPELPAPTADSEKSLEAGPLKSPTKEMQGVRKGEGSKVKPTESSASEVLSQPVAEAFTVIPVGNPTDQTFTGIRNLIEVPLSVLKPPEGQGLGAGDGGDPSGEIHLEDQKMCCGFFFKDDQKGEEDIALKRAALLEKRMRRERETQQKKQQLEVELEQKKEEARMKAEEERKKKEEDKARREYIKQEYLLRKQLKLMEDMDSVIKPRPSSTKQKKPRPKSMHRDSMESPKVPPRAGSGSRPRVYSVSSLSLASLNLGDNDSVNSDKRTPRSSKLASGSLYFFLNSPKVKKARPDSADGFLSPCLLGSGNGDKDWENGSTTSSVASNTEYTGPKLYKEPSAKSNKHIIQNALAHCCLAGKVNEGQKNRILEEMEKSEANNFLILFRDSGCQFRSLYTYCPETEEIAKLAGIGPKSITQKMIEGLFKYNSDRKQFSHIPAKTMSASVDAITIYGHLWQTKKPGTPKKALPTKS
ncbi:calmodulin-regulated spectrin-associated protein 2-like isoform X1 [Megalops cyprinoides]|uniref:calmodulin-regulated spectrin-associated protein 2-like isoform X1 n=1 Tax=Megalops cyprinoides TaxID=118141 RepID=UPI00186448AD|nr:calmodulin-regulated spectrin-associated protein 2-like isoform X1 [Megalops cyprinoides]